MVVKRALEIVLELAEGNVLDAGGEPGMKAEERRQREALREARAFLESDAVREAAKGWRK